MTFAHSTQTFPTSSKNGSPLYRKDLHIHKHPFGENDASLKNTPHHTKLCKKSAYFPEWIYQDIVFNLIAIQTNNSSLPTTKQPHLQRWICLEKLSHICTFSSLLALHTPTLLKRTRAKRYTLRTWQQRLKKTCENFWKKGFLSHFVLIWAEYLHFLTLKRDKINAKKPPSFTYQECSHSKRKSNNPKKCCSFPWMIAYKVCHGARFYIAQGYIDMFVG